MGLGLNYEQKVQIGEHVFIKPPCPTDKREVLFLEEKGAYWRRPTDYKQIWYDFIPFFTLIYQETTIYSDTDGSLLSLNPEDSDYIIRVYEIEMYRRRNGIFFRNGDDIEWLSGNHWFALAHCKMLGLAEDYGKFLKFQRDHFYLKEKVWASMHILGQYTSKPKKTGITQLEACYYVNKATMTPGQQMGVMSTSKDVAETVNMALFYHAFDGLPNPFKPRIKLRSQDSITFGDKPFTGRGKAAIARLANPNADSALNTRVYAAATKARGFDAPKMHDEALDEFPKYDTEGKQSPKTIFENNQEAVKMGTIFNGRIWIFSYPPESDTDGYAEARTIYMDSKLRTMNERGRTKTGLICYHISSLYAQWEAFDKQGNCDAKKAFYLNDLERQAVKDDPKAYQAKVRQYAIDEKEAWAVGGKGSVFNNIRLAELMLALEDERNLNPLDDHLKGKFVWDNELWESGKKNKRPVGQFVPVKFVPISDDERRTVRDARLRLYQTIPDHMANLSLRHGRDEDGSLLPPPKYTFIGAVDPTDYAASEIVLEGSKTASMTMNLPDEAMDSRSSKLVSKIIFSEYLWRAGNANEAYEDIVKEIIYYDKLVLVESNKLWLITRLMEDGLGYHCLVRDAETKTIRLWQPDKPWLPIHMTASAGRNDLLEQIVQLLYDYFDYADEGDKDYGGACKSERLMDQMMRFKAEDTKKSDLVMCGGYLLMALEIYLQLLLQPNDDEYGINDIACALLALRGR